MAVTENAKKVLDQYGLNDPELEKTDLEFLERLENFMFDEVVNTAPQPVSKPFTERHRYMCILATLMGCQGIDLFKVNVSAALKAGVKPNEIKEIVYQGCDYLGYGRVYPFLRAVNEVFGKEGIALPLENAATTTMENRIEEGLQTQVNLFGEGMRNFIKNAPEESRHINVWLSGNCFGDYYTRKGLNYSEREMITFCFLSAQGGVEPQLTSHSDANFKNGNDKDFMMAVVSASVPYIGYPRTLNAIRCLNTAYESFIANKK